MACTILAIIIKEIIKSKCIPALGCMLSMLLTVIEDVQSGTNIKCKMPSTVFVVIPSPIEFN